MSITGEIRTLYSDREQTQAVFPRTKVKAVSDDNGTGLNVLLDNIHANIDGLTYSDVGAAPAGYGLGVRTPRHISSVEELDLITDSGWYSLLCHDGLYIIPGYFFAYGLMRVDSYGEGVCTQTLRHIQSEDIIMRQYTSTGGWGEWKRCDPSAFAPAGYGLGEDAPSITLTDCNDATKSGWYRTADGTANQPLARANWIRVDAYSSTYLCQTWFNDQYDGCTATRFKIGDNKWTHWEWVNPSMALGVEYRTTERWNAKPVYTKLVDCGYLPNNSHTSVGWGADGNCYPIRWCGCAQISNSQDHKGLPYSYLDNSIQVGITNWSILLTTSNDYSTQKAYVQIWYTKEV